MRFTTRLGAALGLFAVLFGVSHIASAVPMGSSSHTASLAGSDTPRIDWP
ncbi:hypothetical protein [Streptomyces coeruleorubidus]